jgi:ribonuclease P protein component
VSTTLPASPASAPRPQLWRVTDQASFAALRSTGQRCRAGSVTVTWLAPDPDGSSPPRVAFAVGRAIGGAVVRNRIRRRLRAGLRALQGSSALPAGTYLVGGSPRLATMPWTALLRDLRAAVAGATASSVAP